MIARFLVFLFFLLAGSVSYAGESVPEKSFEKINNCLKNDDTQTCRKLFTQDSLSLYDRFMGYGLVGCLPKDSQYVSSEQENNIATIKAKTMDMGKERLMRLIFVADGGKWQLDVPRSLRKAMGKNWEQKINMTEQIYLMMKQQMGEKLNCETIRGLFQAKKK